MRFSPQRPRQLENTFASDFFFVSQKLNRFLLGVCLGLIFYFSEKGERVLYKNPRTSVYMHMCVWCLMFGNAPIIATMNFRSCVSEKKILCVVQFLFHHFDSGEWTYMRGLMKTTFNTVLPRGLSLWLESPDQCEKEHYLEIPYKFGSWGQILASEKILTKCSLTGDLLFL